MRRRRASPLRSRGRPLLRAGAHSPQQRQRLGAIDRNIATHILRLVVGPPAVTWVTTHFEREVCVIASAQSSTTDDTAHRWRAFALLAVTYFMTIVGLPIGNRAFPR